jgi:antitoxin component YwqK of YwqJK toxin-antitoxin module
MSRIFLCIIFLASCSPQAETNQETGEPAASPDLPPGAVVEDYSDQTGISKVLVKDNVGTILQEGILRGGKREGNWTIYHPGGFIKSIVPYVNGMKEGVSIEMGTNNQLTLKVGYHHDLRHGEYREYLYSTLKEERQYQNDKIEGVVKVYYDTGKIQEEATYKNGTRDGVSKWYDQEGNVTIEYEYKDGQLVKK